MKIYLALALIFTSSLFSNVDFLNLLEASQAFHIKTPFPVKDNCIAAIGKTAKKQIAIAQQAASAHPLMHAQVMTLIKNFLDYKKKHGTAIEKALYETMSISQCIDRLLINRPLMFMTQEDSYLLRNGQQGKGGFELIGTQSEKYPLILKDYLSYDEMCIAALIGVSCPTYFINNGSRTNCGISALSESYQKSGVYAGLVGARFEKPGRMEWQHMIITPTQNTLINGYGLQKNQIDAKLSLLTIWQDFYG